MEELLKIAKEKYPVGCKFIPLNLEFIGKDIEFQIIELNTDFRRNVWVGAKDSISIDTGKFMSLVYLEGIWAKIISKPEVKYDSFKWEELQPGGGIIPGQETFKEPKKDNINPSHYKNGKVECIDALESATVNKTGLEAVCTANVIKYLWRYEDKNGLEDVKKAQWYLEKLIKHLKVK